MKIKLLAFLAIVLSLSSYAQEEESTFRYGPRFGLSLSELKGTENLKSLRSTFSAGMMSEYKLNKTFSLYSELNYSRQGSTDRGNEQGSFFENSINLDYINVPLLVKYYLKDGLAIEAGPQFGYLLNAKYKSKQVENPTVLNVKEDVENFDFSFVLGASFKTEWGFVVGARYNLGINDINKSLNSELGSLRNAVFQLYFGYLFQ